MTMRLEDLGVSLGTPHPFATISAQVHGPKPPPPPPKSPHKPDPLKQPPKK